MAENLIGVDVSGDNTDQALARILRCEAAGIPAVWMTTGGAQLDSITVMAAAAGRTKTVKFGTSIVPIFPRHPLVMAQQAQVVGQLAPGRFRLGIGPSHRPSMRSMGIAMRDPLGHLREYLRILKSLLQTGAVDFDGEFYQAHEAIPEPLDIPVMASALQQRSFELCGAESDGAISWICPGTYLRDMALPAMDRGAKEAGRRTPPLIAHAPACVHENFADVRAAVQREMGHPRMPFYQRMLADAGFPEAANGAWSDAMVDSIVLWGDEAKVTERINELFAWGAAEVLISPVGAGDDEAESVHRTTRLIAKLSTGSAA